ncbi:hypothetical protein L226DRAFT_573965 [Lentinus tigrinus ALCF2SS1-7]|uniref:Phosphatidate phosphatase APP1 catalytic domain-containing protein n=1 Tax=Lentinus tigrinus ALCF2SS1-6 TaxID=1328759 RepID=A0A5C2RZ77_9APHY|nr:hypothetical protein L227DRAFT_257302 [Lentinus tigrinus ALCF2SS1-6]RPD71495.1 hypothetical protein L226DRAFT_573965 [Lentinus tigrinus ALCF2SS1-7]
MLALPHTLVALSLAVLVAASPAPNPAPAPAPTPAPAPAPQAASSIESIFSSATGAVASALPTILGGWPSLSDIEKKIGVNNGNDLSNVSASALLIPSYANYSGNWNLRFYGLAYKLPNISTSDLDSLIDGLSTNNLNSTQQQLLQNRTQDLASIPIPKANLTALVFANGSSITNSSGIQLQTTDDFGEFDQFVTVPGLGDNSSTSVQVIQTGIMNVTGPGNGTVILVPSTGISIVSDIDDVMRITKVYVPNQGLNNSFVQPYVNVPGVPELFAMWAKNLSSAAFHYDTTTPVELTRTYVDYLFNNFPLGSLEMRPINLTEPSQVLDARQNSLLKLFQTFPKRKFVLVGDTSSSTLLSAYPQIAQQFPNNIACIFIRNTSATDSDDKIPYDTSPFKNVKNGTYFFYRTAEDLMNLDIEGGQCVNSSIPQNVTFGEQGGFLDSGAAIAFGRTQYAAAVVGAAVALALSLF